jgi:hypothetical protein
MHLMIFLGTDYAECTDLLYPFFPFPCNPRNPCLKENNKISKLPFNRSLKAMSSNPCYNVASVRHTLHHKSPSHRLCCRPHPSQPHTSG